MPSYYYRARDMEGRPHEGVEVAASEEEVLRFLENSRLIPVKIESRELGGSPYDPPANAERAIPRAFRRALESLLEDPAIAAALR